MCFLMKARMLGAGIIIAVDLSGYRLQFAKRRGADHVLNASNTSLAERLDFVRGLTHGRGADLVIGTAGVSQTVPEALDMMRLGGLLVEAGNFSDLGEVAISPHRHICAKSARILGVGGEEPAVRTKHAADGSLHAVPLSAGICLSPFCPAGCQSRGA